ncbi:MAG: hypothetical protein RIS09_117 [Actinomycetota bacterium]|jgi:hypothetical protein
MGQNYLFHSIHNAYYYDETYKEEKKEIYSVERLWKGYVRLMAHTSTRTKGGKHDQTKLHPPHARGGSLGLNELNGS